MCDDCPICLDPMGTSLPFCKLPCSHIFHECCLSKLRAVGVSQTCPMCRAPLPPCPHDLFDEALEYYADIEAQVAGGDASWDQLTLTQQLQMDLAINLWQTAADSGLKEAAYNLALMFRLGRGVAQCNIMAVNWYEIAARQGHANAQNNLGFMFNHGRGVARDEVAAARWYRLAAEQGLTDAQYNIGVMSRQGRGTAQSNSEALRWYTLAAVGGSVDAREALRRMKSEQQQQTAARRMQPARTNLRRKMLSKQ